MMIPEQEAKELCIRLAQHLTWSGMSAADLEQKSRVNARTLLNLKKKGDALARGASSKQLFKSGIQTGTRVKIEPHLWSLAALSMRELGDALVGARLNAKETAKSGRIVVVVGSGLADWAGVQDAWAQLGRKVLNQAARASGMNPRAKDHDLKGHFYRTVWRSLADVAGDVGLPPRTEGSARAAIRKLMAKHSDGSPPRVETQHLCATLWRTEAARSGLASMIEKRFTRRPLVNVPGLGNEILAHMVNAGVVHHVVSANIDDSLDRAFDLEIGRDNYDRVLSDNAQLSAPEKSKPCLVKLHGSIRAPATLSFESTLGGKLSQDMTGLLDRMVWGNEPPDLVPKVRIVSLGYRWSGGALAHWMRSRADHLERIYVVRRDSQPYPELAPLENKCSVISLNELDAKKDEDGIGIGEFLWALWLLVQGIPPDFAPVSKDRSEGVPEQRLLKSKVPNIARHLVLATLFALPAPGDTAKNRHSCRNQHNDRERLFADVLLHLAKCKGMINAHAMAADPRLSILFDEARRRESPLEPSLSPPQFLRRYSADLETEPAAFLVPSESPFAGDTYFSSARSVSGLAQSFWRGRVLLPHVERKKAGKLEGSEMVRCPRITECGLIAMDRQSVTKFVEKQVELIFDASDVEVRRDGDARSNWMFTKPDPLDRHTDLWEKVESLVRDGDWSDLLVITEWSGRHAKMIQQREADGRKRRVLMIEPSRSTLEPWALRERALKRLKGDQLVPSRAQTGTNDNISTYLLQVPWYAHHQHFTLALRDGQPLEATFARRFLKATVIAPIATDSPEDCVELLIQFLGTTRHAESEHQDADPYSSGPADFRTEAKSVAKKTLAWLGERKSREAERLRSILATFKEAERRRDEPFEEPARSTMKPSPATRERASRDSESAVARKRRHR